MEDVHAPHGVVNTNQALWLWLGGMSGASDRVHCASRHLHTSRQTGLCMFGAASKYEHKLT